MTVRKTGRRLFLIGAGGFTLSIPFLPSLLRRGEAQVDVSKRFVGMAIEHGGVRHENMWPADSATTDVTTVMSDHGVSYGALAPTIEGADSVLSNVLRAPSSLMTPTLLSKMNILRGLDVPWYASHGQHMLGSYGAISRAAGDEETTVANQPSIDRIMAYSSAVYPMEPRKRSMHIGGEGLSTSWSSPSTRSGGIQRVPSANGTRALFDEIWDPPVDPGGPPPRPHVVDRVLESYNRVRSGAHGPGARLGAADRVRLDEYMARLSAIQASLSSTVAATCSDVREPTADYDGRFAVYGPYANDPGWYGPNLYGLYNDVIVAAFMCDSSRIATIMSPDDFHGGMDSVGGFHEVAHTSASQPEREAMLQITNRNFFSMVFLDLVSKLDSVLDVDGNTLLDNSVVMATNESGPETHTNDSQPVWMAGSCAGYFNTGMYVDYRNRARQFDNPYDSEPDPALAAAGRLPGLHYYGLLATMLYAMGVPPDEWPRGPGMPYSDSDAVPTWFETRHPYLDQMLAYSVNALPVITGS